MKYRYTKYHRRGSRRASTSRICCRGSPICCCRAASTTRTVSRTRTTTAGALDAVAARRDPRGDPQRRPAVGRDARAAARQGLAAGRRRGRAARRSDSAASSRSCRTRATSPARPPGGRSGESARGPRQGGGGREEQVRFEITDKSLDFLGYRALRDLLGSIGKSSIGRHDTREMATGIEASGAPKPYEFGDTMNIDASSTILNAVQRQQRDRPARQSRSTTRT